MRKLATATVGALALALASCGGSGGSSETLGGGTSSSSSSTTSSSSTYSMGNGSGSSFQAGVIAITNANLSAGGTTSLAISIVDQHGTLYTGAATTITINSPCISQGLAVIAATGTTTAGSSAGQVVTNTGSADATYTAQGCTGADVITASATVNSQNLTATGTVTVAAATIGSLKFISATPTTIGLKGTGLGDTSTVIFEVVDATGAAVPGATVSFSLNTSVGGLSVAPTSAVSGTNGQVQTVVSSGTVHTAVRVTASIASPALSTQSSQLTVTTGLPASNGFTIAVGAASYPGGGTAANACPNVEAYNLDGVQVPVTVWLADRYNNPAPDGTAAAFTTDAGNIGGSCTTPLKTSGDGACQVTWTSANPRPQPSQDVPPIPSAGNGVILATAIGEESFVDSTGSGFYVMGDAFSNLGEPFLDENQDGIYEYPYEPFLDYYKTGKYEGPSGSFIGITCNGTSATSTCTENTLAIGVLHVIIMSTGGAQIVPGSVSSGGSFSAYAPVSGNYPETSALTIAYSSSGSLTFSLEDLNGNPLAADAVVSITADSAIGQIDPNLAGYTMGCSEKPGGHAYTTSLISAAVPSPPAPLSGSIYITVVSPGTSTKTTFSFPVVVN